MKEEENDLFPLYLRELTPPALEGLAQRMDQRKAELLGQNKSIDAM